MATANPKEDKRGEVAQIPLGEIGGRLFMSLRKSGDII